MKPHPDNDYQNENHEPKDGFLEECLAFERATGLERRKTLSAEEVEALEKADENLAKKMNS